MPTQSQHLFTTAAGIGIRRSTSVLDYRSAVADLADSLNTQHGVLLASSFEYPGRYTRWDIGFINPPLMLEASGRRLTITALNTRGRILLPELHQALSGCTEIDELEAASEILRIRVTEPVAELNEEFSEEMRSRRPTVFSVLRTLQRALYTAEDAYLGFYGAFGYDLTFQFEDVTRFQQRAPEQRDLVLYFPDQITVADHRAERTLCHSYEFNCRSWDSPRRTETTGGFHRAGTNADYAPALTVAADCDHEPGEFAAQVKRAQGYFRRGDLFEVVPGQTFFEPCKDSPATVFKRLREANPAPYGALMNLGRREYLIAASPEMFVRVEGRQIETCPISGTIERGADAIADAEQIRTLLNSKKDEAELSMCTDVDRNDKARVCEPGSVQVVGRRQIEMYSRLIHTVDHVKGRLKPEFDALDGFLAHTWAVTVTGAPKLAAMQYLERFEKSPRHWYGGALGQIGCDGNLNTGLTLRTIRVKDGVAEIRAGATLLADSEPDAEEQETRLKAAALVAAVRGDAGPAADGVRRRSRRKRVGAGLTALMVDHRDSFVHNLASYFRQCGVELTTLRPEPARRYLAERRPDLVILSPGPGRPADFALQDTIALALQQHCSVFGVCLGLQGVVEYFGGSLRILDPPMHGKPSAILHQGTALFAGIEPRFDAGRYHSLVADSPGRELRVTASTEAGEVMAVEHERLPVSAVQFHPESIMSLGGEAGMRLIENVVRATARLRASPNCS